MRIVLTVDPRGVHQQVEQIVVGRTHGFVVRGVVVTHRIQRGGPSTRSVVEGGLIGQRGGRHLGENLSVKAPTNSQHAHRVAAVVAFGFDNVAHHTRAYFPLRAEFGHSVPTLRRDDGEHALLALGRHDLKGLHSRLTQRHGRDVHVHPHAATGRGFAGRADKSRTSQVLDAQHQPTIEQFQARLDESLLLVGVTDLHARALCVIQRRSPVFAVEARRSQYRDSANAISAR